MCLDTKVLKVLSHFCWSPEEFQQDEWGKMRKHVDKRIQIWTNEQVFGQKSFYISLDCSEILLRSKCQHILCCSEMFIYLHASTLLTQINMCIVYYHLADLFYTRTRCRFLLISSCQFSRINNWTKCFSQTFWIDEVNRTDSVRLTFVVSRTDTWLIRINHMSVRLTTNVSRTDCTTIKLE